MSPSEDAVNDEILNEVLQRLKGIENRLDRLEGHETEPITPPPVVRKPFPQPKEFRAQERAERIRRVHTPSQAKEPAKPKEPEPAEPKPVKKKEDQEFVFGSKVVPRVGMGLLLIGIFYLVALGVRDGWIGPTQQFIGELLLCGALIGVGIWKLNEREHFGYVLVGGGSCGLYASFAGAYEYKDLLSAEWLVGLFAVLSIVNLTFSWWRSSKSFWMIGFVGGLIAAGMPMDRGDHQSSLALAGIIVLAATLLAAYRQWFKALAGLWLVSSVFVFAVLQRTLPDISVSAAISVFYAFSLTPIVAHAVRFVPNKFDEKGWFLIFAGGITALATLTIGRDVLPVPHSVGIVVWSLPLFALAHYVRKQAHAPVLLLTGLVVATVVAPMGFTSFAACLTYAGLGLMTTLYVRARDKGLAKAGAALSTAFACLTIAAYAIAMSSGSMETVQEMTMLGAIALGIANVAFVAGKLEQRMSVAVTAAAAVFYPVLTRAAYISVETDQAFAILASQAVYVVVIAIVAIRAKMSGLGVLGLLFSAIAAIVYWGSIANSASDVNSGREIIVLLVLTGALVLSAIGAGRDVTERNTTSMVAAIIGGFVVVPAVFLALGFPGSGLLERPAMTAAIAIYAIVLGVVSLAVKWHGHAIIGAVTIVVGTIYYWSEVASFPGTGVQIFLTLIMSVAVALTAFSTARNDAARQFAWIGASVLGLFVLARVFFLVLTLPAIGMFEYSAFLCSWAIYATALAAVSLRAQTHAISTVSYIVALLTVVLFWNYRYVGPYVFSAGDELIMTGLMSAALVLATLGVGKSKEELHKAAVLTSIVGWFVFAWLINVALTLPAIGMAKQAALTTSWSLYSALVLTLGFVFNFKYLRIASLVMFGVTIAKVLIVDLARLDDIIRVVVFFILGGLLLLAGYIYVRKRPNSSSTS